MYKKKFVKTQNVKAPTENQKKGNAEILVHRTSSKKAKSPSPSSAT